MCRQKALFLDRDGVINLEQGYVHSEADFIFKEGIFDLCRAAQALDYLLIVVTNQAGIARGYYTEEQFLALTDWMNRQFAEQQVKITRVYYCPYHPVHGIGKYKVDSPDRKPRPGLLLRAREDLDLDLGASVLIGDAVSDIKAGMEAGVGRLILLRSPAFKSARAEIECDVAHSLDEIRSKFFPAKSYCSQ